MATSRLLSPRVVEFDVRDPLGAVAEIDEEAHERALHDERDSQQHENTEPRRVNHVALLRPETHRTGEGARAAAEQYGGRGCEDAGLPRRSSVAAKADHRRVLVLRRNHES